MEERERNRGSSRNRLARFFLHGLAFSVLLSLAVLAWEFPALLLAVVGFRIAYIVGLLVGLAVAFFILLAIVGCLNILLTEFIWHVSIRQDWKSFLAHSTLLFISLIIASVPGFILNFMFHNWLAAIVISVTYCFIDGFVAKEVAFVWETAERSEETLREALTVLKYPVLISLFMADVIVVFPLFILSLATYLWWFGSIMFILSQSPLIYLVIMGIIHEKSWTPAPSGGWWVPTQPQKLDKASAEERKTEKRFSASFLLGRFFLHGLAFSALLLAAGLMWQFLTVLFAWVASDLIGLILSLVMGLALAAFLLLPVVGGLNVFLTESIWHVSIKKDYKRLLAHGFALTIALNLAEAIPLAIFYLMVPSVIPIAVFPILYCSIIILYCLIDGLLARRIAFIWEIREKLAVPDSIFPIPC